MSFAILILVFAVFTALMFTRRMPALLAIPSMAVVIAAVVGTPPAEILNNVVSAGSTKLASAYVAVFAGAMLGRVMMQTGIAEAIIKRAAEFGGDKPLVVAFGLMIVTAVLFTSLTGLGAVIMVGSLVLPIMMSLGIPRRLAGTVFLLAFATGFIFNISLVRFYREILQFAQDAPLPREVVTFQFVLLGVMVAGVVGYTLLAVRRAPELRFMTALDKDAILATVEDRGVGLLSFLTPIIPLALYFGFSSYGWREVPSFLAGSVFGTLTTRPRDAVRILTQSLIRGLEDGAPAAILMMGIGMLINTLQLPAVREVVEPVVKALPISSPVSFVVFFGVFSPLALYRGPFNLFGLGAGFFAILAAAGLVPPIAVLAAAMAIVQLQNVCDPTNTHNVWTANFVGERVESLTKATLPTMMLICVATLIVAALMFLR